MRRNASWRKRDGRSASLKLTKTRRGTRYAFPRESIGAIRLDEQDSIIDTRSIDYDKPNRESTSFTCMHLLNQEFWNQQRAEVRAADDVDESDRRRERANSVLGIYAKRTASPIRGPDRLNIRR